jgi:hypothetical protein
MELVIFAIYCIECTRTRDQTADVCPSKHLVDLQAPVVGIILGFLKIPTEHYFVFFVYPRSIQTTAFKIGDHRVKAVFTTGKNHVWINPVKVVFSLIGL